MSDAHAFLPIGRLAAVLSVAMVLGACGGGGGDEAAASSGATPPDATGGTDGALLALDASTSCGLPDFRASLLQLINAARASARTCGSTAMPAVGAVAWDDRLFSAAARHSREMAQNNVFSHTGLNGSSPAQRIAAEGYAASWSGENIAAGYTSAADVMNGWLASAGHCSNLMRAEYQDVAVSCVYQAGSSYGQYWTLVLARPQ